MISNDLNFIASSSINNTSNASQLNTSTANTSTISNNNQNVIPSQQQQQQQSTLEWSILSDDPFSNNESTTNTFDPFTNNNSISDPFTTFETDPFASTVNTIDATIDPFANSNGTDSVDPWANFGTNNTVSTFDDAFNAFDSTAAAATGFDDDSWNTSATTKIPKNISSNSISDSVQADNNSKANNWAIFDDG